MSTPQNPTRFASQPRQPLPGSERAPFSPDTPIAAYAASVAAEPSASEVEQAEITVSVLLRRRQALEPAESAARLTRQQFAERHGAAPASAELVHAFAREFGLTVTAGPGPRTIHVTGTRQALEQAFGVTLTDTVLAGVTLRTRTGPVMLPQELGGHVEAVLGLDNRPQARPQSRLAVPRATNVSYTPVQVAGLYGYPTSGAAGQTIGLIELGGGFRPADISAYFQTLNLPVPTVTAVAVDKGKNQPSTASGADGEVMLDIEVAAAVAPGVKLAVYFSPNTDQGFIDAVTEAVHDSTHKPAVISISWGGPESSWTRQALTALDSACQAAAALGVTITVAAGDNGSSDGTSGNQVDFPASSPHVLACGGTKLTASGTRISYEVVWNETAANEGATGGGVSAHFARPSWQAKANVPAAPAAGGGRGVPDVAGDADPATGYTIRVDGQTTVIGGTSAVAPLWAGLIALANAANGNDAGFVNPALYGAGGGGAGGDGAGGEGAGGGGAAGAFRDITSGNNGAFAAGPGWDACTGLGSPVGAAVVKALAGS